MDLRVVQRLLADAGFNPGAIDGLIGPRTLAAMHAALLSVDIGGWSANRIQVGAGQASLAALGVSPGAIDGIMGPKTRAALAKKYPAEALEDWPLQRNVSRFFGAAGSPSCSSGSVTLPFSFPLAWNLDQSIDSFACHELVAKPLTDIFADAAKHYGEKRFRDLRLYRYGGCYQYRKMRGGSSMSMHAYGIAVDLDPERNQLRWGADRAAFARPEYDAFWRIVESHGAISLGRAWNYDFMHFQFARL